MVNNGQVPIRTVIYRSPADAPFGVEVMSFDQLRGMARASRRAAPQRPRFHVLAVVEQGAGHHTADFERYALAPGSALWIRPGQVHQLDGVEQVQGTIVLFQPDFLAPGTLAQAAADDIFGAKGWVLTESRKPLALLALEHLRTEYVRGAGDPVPERIEVLRQLLTVLVLRVLPESGIGAVRADEAFLRFREEVEQHFAASRQVSWYAQRLGYSVRTLARATSTAVGLGAKEFIDQRVLLEAKRLLVHGDLTVAQCARQVGFDDTANFGKFFERQVGLPPGEFRRSGVSGQNRRDD